MTDTLLGWQDLVAIAAVLFFLAAGAAYLDDK